MGWARKGAKTQRGRRRGEEEEGKKRGEEEEGRGRSEIGGDWWRSELVIAFGAGEEEGAVEDDCADDGGAEVEELFGAG